MKGLNKALYKTAEMLDAFYFTTQLCISDHLSIDQYFCDISSDMVDTVKISYLLI